MTSLAARAASAGLLRRVATLASLAVLALAAYAIHKALADISIARVAAAFHAITPTQVLTSALLTAGSFLALTGFDALALRHVGSPLPYRQTALVSFIAQAISHTTGFAAVAGSSVRFRLYSSAGLSAMDVAQVVAFCGLAFALGAVGVTAAAALFEPYRVAHATKLPNAVVVITGVVLFALLCGWFVVSALRPRIKAFGQEIVLPDWRSSFGQFLFAVADLTLAAGAAFVLLPHGHLGFPAFVGLYVVAIVAGVISHVPAGAGVFEGMILLLVPDVPRAELLGGLLLYRLVYNLFPLAIASALLAGLEMADRLHAVRAAWQRVTGIADRIAPNAFAALATLCGVVLLASSATPAAPGRLEVLEGFVPLAILELSHMLGSIVGLLLLFVARGLFRRLDAAWWIALALLVAGAFFSLLKGFDWEEATLLAAAALLLAMSHKAFYRKASIFSQRYTPGWMFAIAVVLAGTAWLAMFSFKYRQYSTQVWWEFALNSQAPRALRTTVAVLAIGVALMAMRLLAPAAPRPRPPDEQGMADARAVLRSAATTEAHLVLLRDKALLFSEDRDAFIMYGAWGRCLVVMGDPVGPPSAWADLIWSFRDLCDRLAAWPVFYQVRADALPLYLELGLSFIKLGEEAVVPLAGFSLDGKPRSELRYAHRRAIKEGASFEIVPGREIEPLLPQLEAVSNAWLASKRTREKRFSLGRFSAEYLAQFPLAVVRREGKVVAFANLWLGPDKAEMAVDLMRYSADGGYGVMDYLFVELMLWGRDQGFGAFSLGLAPLSGLRDSPLAPLWTRAGAFIFNHGEGLYNFQGLRRYKEKFLPQWRARFMAAPGGAALPQVVMDVAGLISGGAKGLIAK